MSSLHDRRQPRRRRFGPGHLADAIRPAVLMDASAALLAIGIGPTLAWFFVWRHGA